MAVDTKKTVQKNSGKNYLAKDFDSFKTELVTYARNYFIQQNADFSEASLGGMFVELAAYVGDSLSFFLDHQFNELDPETAVETNNVIAHARNAGVKAAGAAPAVTDLKIFIEVPSELSEGAYVPMGSALPIIREGTTCSSTTGPTFTIYQDLDFSEKDINGNYLASIITSQLDSSGNPAAFIMSRVIGAVSGEIKVQSVTVGSQVPFRKILLNDSNISEIISVIDSDGNNYYEVDYLTQDTVFKRSRNISQDQFEVPSNIEVISAPRRFTRDVDPISTNTTLTFGSGDASSTEDDAIPDPSKLALPLYGRNTFQRFSIDPKNLLNTNTLGIAPSNTTLRITYRAGGGAFHNVGANTINTFSNVDIVFPKNPSAVISANVVNSLDVLNERPASGGAPKQTIEELRTSIFSARNEQSRVVTQDDLLSRIYTLPPQFGRIYRASIRKSTRNPLASELYILSRNAAGQLTGSPDTLKKNLSKYLNEFRLISDAIDVLDATVINYGLEYSIVVAPDVNKSQVNLAVISELSKITNNRFYQIDQPLVEADFINIIINVPGVLALEKLIFFNRTGEVSGRTYSNFNYDLESNKFKGMIVGPPGSIFELRFPNSDIIGQAE